MWKTSVCLAHKVLESRTEEQRSSRAGAASLQEGTDVTETGEQLWISLCSCPRNIRACTTAASGLGLPVRTEQMKCGGLSSALRHGGDSQARGSGITGLPSCFWGSHCGCQWSLRLSAGLERCAGCPGAARINAQPSTRPLQLSPALAQHRTAGAGCVLVSSESLGPCRAQHQVAPCCPWLGSAPCPPAHPTGLGLLGLGLRLRSL